MALQQQGPAPYTSPSAIVALVQRFRDHGLTTPFDLDVLIRAGITEGLAPRTLHALRQLDLIDEDGDPTEALEGLRLAPSDSYRERFAEVIRAAYAPVFQYVDPSTDGVERVRDAFRPYTPVGQQGRMVTLFLGLCEHAGVIEQRPTPAQLSRPATARGPRAASRARGRRQAGLVGPSEARRDVPEALVALMRQAFPASGSTWTSEQRDRFLETFTTVLNFSVPVLDPTLDDDQDGHDGSDEEVSQ